MLLIFAVLFLCHGFLTVCFVCLDTRVDNFVGISTIRACIRRESEYFTLSIDIKIVDVYFQTEFSSSGTRFLRRYDMTLVQRSSILRRRLHIDSVNYERTLVEILFALGPNTGQLSELME